MDKETQEKQQAQADQEKEIQTELKLEKLKLSKGKAVKTAAAAVVLAALALVLCVMFFRGQGSRTIAAYLSLGDVTFTDKTKQEDGCFVTFTAAAYNCLPEELNESGVTIRINEEIYNALALNVEYSAATVSFTGMPVREASRAGYRESEGNMSVLWQDELISKYGCVISLVW